MTTFGASSLRHLSFVLPSPASGADPQTALDTALELIALGETLGYTGAWVPWRAPDDTVWSAIAVLAAGTLHTRWIELGAHDVPAGDIGRHDLPAVDLLSRGRFQLGLDDAEGSPVPHFPGAEALLARSWVKALDADGARRAAADARRLFTGSRGLNGPDDIAGSAATAQAALVDAYREKATPAAPLRVAVGRVVLPLDSADEATRQLFRKIADSATRPDREVPAAVGASDALTAQLAADPALARADELRLELPQGCDAGALAQILHDVALYVAPELGWRAPAWPSPDFSALYI